MKTIVLILATLVLISSTAWGAVERDTLPQTIVKETEIRQEYSDRNYGSISGLGGLSLDSAAGNGDFLIIFADSALDTTSVLENGAFVLYAEVPITTGIAGVAGWFYLYQIDPSKAVQEGSGNGSLITNINTRHGVNGGTTWDRANTPVLDLSTEPPADSMNWADSTYFGPIEDQGTCGGCTGFGTAGEIEFDYARTVLGNINLGPNTDDSTGADINKTPEIQDETYGKYFQEVTSTGWTRLYFRNDILTDPGDTACIVVEFYDGEGALRFPVDSLRLYVAYQDTGWAAGEEATIMYSDGIFRAAALCDSDVDSIWDTDTYDTLIMNSDIPKLLFAVDDLCAFLDPLDTIAVFTFNQPIGIDLYINNLPVACSLKVSLMYKPLFDPGNCNWKYWNASSYYNWGAAGCELPNGIDVSQQQLLTCGGGSCDGSDVSEMLDSLLLTIDFIVNETGMPYLAADGTFADCYSLNAADSVAKMTWYWALDREQQGVDTLHRALMRGPIEVQHLSHVYWKSTGYWECGEEDFDLQHPYPAEEGGHVELIVGYYGDSTWVIRNQYGEDWGCNGYGNIADTSMGWIETYMVSVTESPTAWDTPGCAGAGDRAQTPCAMIYLTPNSTDTLRIPGQRFNQVLKDGGQAAFLLVPQGTANANINAPLSMELMVIYPTTSIGGGVDIGANTDM